MRDKQGIPLLQMFAQCALHGATLEAAQSCIIWDAAIHQASRSVDLEVSFSYPIPPDQVAAIQQSICLAYGLQAATLRQPQPRRSPLRNLFRSRFPHPSQRQRNLSWMPEQGMTSPCQRSRRRRRSLRNPAGKNCRRNR